MTQLQIGPAPADPLPVECGVLRALVVDDEPLARDRLVRLLAEMDDVRIVGECTSGEEAVQSILTLAPDVVFLDVQMSNLDGVEVVRRVGAERMPPVVFVTAFDRYALPAFEVNALDYLLKPYTPARLRAALDRVRERLRTAEAAQQARRLLSLVAEFTAQAPALPAGPRRSYLERFAVKVEERTTFVRARDADWIEAARNYVRVHAGKDTYVLREKVGRLERQLDPARFARCHRRVIVNLERVKEVQPWFGGDSVLVLQDGTQLRLSRTFRRAFLGRLSGVA
ncbi:MAG TPA: LytTR family DNA-binding domain-containing protein [Gemmatimonadales bacterium]|nr:LytTR family DNA-binding domain-containing protein [Gemmatimonadales bacterium]